MQTPYYKHLPIQMKYLINGRLLFLLFLLSAFACKPLQKIDSESQLNTRDYQYTSVARVERGDKVGYVNGWGEEILPVEFDEGSHVFYENRITVRKGENWYIYDVLGNLLLDLGEKYKYVGYSGDGLHFVSPDVERVKSNYYFHYPFNLDELRFIDISGKEKVIIKPEKRLFIESPGWMRFKNGYLHLSVIECDTCRIPVMGYADTKGNIVLMPGVYSAETGSTFQEDLLFAGKERYSQNRSTNASYGFVNLAGEWAIAPTYYWIGSSEFVDGAAIVDSVIVENDPNNKSTLSNTFLINPKGERIFPKDVHIMRNIMIHDSVVVVEKYFGEQLKFALAKTDGSFITDFKFDFIQPFYGHGLYLAQMGQEQLYLNRDGKQVNSEWTGLNDQEKTPFYSGLSRSNHYKDGLAILYFEDKKTAVIDMDRNIIRTFPTHRISIEGGIIREVVTPSSSPEGLVLQYYDLEGKPFQLDGYDKVFEFKCLKL